VFWGEGGCCGGKKRSTAKAQPEKGKTVAKGKRLREKGFVLMGRGIGKTGGEKGKGGTPGRREGDVEGKNEV